MGSHGRTASTAGGPRLPDAVPFDLTTVTRLSWELGSQVVSDATRLSEWEHATSGRRLAVYDATDHTVVLGVRTPVGRERFFGATKHDVDAKRSRLRDAENWRRCE
ncbi:hypothetical protein [Halorussus sp. MSC15.2]|uniref:hypothetical protein n=1 Tax=Halorussus sp. MSC15.2 TaxID=2283638 RepID=UPI0013D66C49|nr:hypothetical protein [Halorussus sp. MSC15.2]NEU59243.1 hypothetical protein [Halorussus sp. MSC15.2]